MGWNFPEWILKHKPIVFSVYRSSASKSRNPQKLKIRGWAKKNKSKQANISTSKTRINILMLDKIDKVILQWQN